MATLSTLRDYTYNILNDTVNSSTYTQSLIDQLINDEQVEVCDSFKWSFLRKKYLFIGADDTSLSSDITTGSTTISVADTTDWPSSGAVLIEHDIINYTGKTSTSLTGVTNIGVAHYEGATVYPLWAVPTDYSRQMALYVEASGSSTPVMWQYLDEFTYDTSPEQFVYSILHDNSNNEYIYVNTKFVGQGDMVMFHYLKTPTTLDEDADVSTVPDPYAAKVLPKLVAGKAMMLFGDNVDGLGSSNIQLAQMELLKMQKHYGEKEQGYSKLIRPSYRSGTNVPRYNPIYYV